MKSRRPEKHRAPSIRCPHCNGRTDVRTSKTLSPTYREISYRCASDECGFAFIAGLSVLRTVRVSATPNPEIQLPFSSQLQPPKPANDDVPFRVARPANDTTMSETG